MKNLPPSGYQLFDALRREHGVDFAFTSKDLVQLEGIKRGTASPYCGAAVKAGVLVGLGKQGRAHVYTFRRKGVKEPQAVAFPDKKEPRAVALPDKADIGALLEIACQVEQKGMSSEVARELLAWLSRHLKEGKW